MRLHGFRVVCDRFNCDIIRSFLVHLSTITIFSYNRKRNRIQQAWKIIIHILINENRYLVQITSQVTASANRMDCSLAQTVPVKMSKIVQHQIADGNTRFRYRIRTTASRTAHFTISRHLKRTNQVESYVFVFARNLT